MPKSKKKKNKDFQKVKLKVGKRLPKADNETRTSFKATSITVPQQLKSKDGTLPTTNRKLSLVDLLSQLHHYNASVRHAAVAGLKELLSTNTSVLQSNLSAILGKISELFVDKDAVVRQAVIRLLKAVIPQLSTNHIVPFFSTISAHLCCAMSHIYEDIRLDSLQLLDIFLENFPTLVTNNSGAILPNFIDQISSSSKSGKSNSGRSLNLNPTCKVSSFKWRNNVLERLQKFIQAMSISINKDPVLTGNNISLQFEDGQIGYQPFSISAQNSWQGYSYHLNSQRMELSRTPARVSQSSESPLMLFFHSLLPLLLECWVEATAVETKGRNSGQDGLVSPESLVVMVNVVKVTQLLWKYVQANSAQSAGFPEQFKTEFYEQLMENFPYSVLEVMSKKDKKSNVLKDKETILSLNLAVCDIMTYFQSDSANGSSCNKSLEPISNFLLSTLNTQKLNQENWASLVSVIRHIMSTHKISKLHLEIIEKCYLMFKVCHVKSFEKKLLLQLLSELALHPKYNAVKAHHPSLDRFLSELPALLSDVVLNFNHHQMAALILQSITEAQIQKKLSVSDEDLSKLLDAEDGVFIKLSAESQSNMATVIYRIQSMNKIQLKSLTQIIKSKSISERLAVFLIQSMSHRYRTDLSCEPGRCFCDLNSYVSFLTTLTLGISGEDLHSDGSGHCWSGYYIHHDDLMMWKHQYVITQGSLLALSHLPSTVDVWTSMQTFLLHTLTIGKVWSSVTVLAIITCVNTLSHQPIKTELLDALVAISLSVLQSVFLMEIHVDQSELKLQHGEFKEEVWRSVITFLSSHDAKLRMFMTKFSQGITTIDLPDSHLEGCISVLTRLLKDPDLLTSLADISHFKQLAQTVLMKGDKIDPKLVSAFKYHLSLIPQGQL